MDFTVCLINVAENVVSWKIAWNYVFTDYLPISECASFSNVENTARCHVRVWFSDGSYKTLYGRDFTAESANYEFDCETGKFITQYPSMLKTQFDSFNIEPRSITRGERLSVGCKLVDEQGPPVQGKTVELVDDTRGIVVLVMETNDIGYAGGYFTPEQAGTHEYRMSFMGTSIYLPTGSTILEIEVKEVVPGEIKILSLSYA